MLAVVVVVAMLALLAVPDEFYVEQARDAVDRRGRPVEITSDPATIARWGRYLGMLTALVQWPLLVLGMAGVLALAFSAGRPGRAPFVQYLALGAHAFLILSLQQLVVLALTAAGAPVASTSLAEPLTAAAGTTLHSVLELIDPFMLWMLVVLGLGAATLNRALGARRAVGVLVGGYLTLALLVGVLTG